MVDSNLRARFTAPVESFIRIEEIHGYRVSSILNEFFNRKRGLMPPPDRDAVYLPDNEPINQ